MTIENGIRIPLIIDGAVILSGVIAVALVYGDVQELKEEQVSEARVVAIEKDVEKIAEDTAEIKEEQKEQSDLLLEILREVKD